MIYSVETVEELLPGVWDSIRVLDAPNPYEPDPEMPKGPARDPRRLSDKMAMVADIQRAWRWADLDLTERQVLFCVYVLQEPQRKIGPLLGFRYESVVEAKESGLQRLVHFLNGTSEEDGNEVGQDDRYL